MVVSIELTGIFRDIAKVETIKMPITGKTPVRDAIEFIRSLYPALPLEKDSFLVSVNNELVPSDRLLQPNDVICFLPHIGGG
jgi:molybdopterin converting factor small subunit